MKSTSRPSASFRQSRAALLLLAALASLPSAFAANAAWNVDADGAWSDSANWNPAAAPGDTSGLASTDVANFSRTLTANRTVTVDANRNVSGITFSQSSNSSYTLSGGSILLSNGGTIQATNSAGTHTDTISAPIVLQGDGGTGNFYGGATSTTQVINITGNVSGVSTAGKTTLLNIFGFNGGTYLINGVISDGTAGGNLAIVKNGSGNWRLNNGNNTYSGGFTTLSGSISFGASSTPTSGTVTSGPAGTGTLTFSGGTVQTGGNFSLANPIFVTAFTSTNVRGTTNANITLTGPITGTGTLNNNHTTSSSAFIQGDISGFTGTVSHTTVTSGNNFTFNGSTPESQNGSSARFSLSGTGSNRSINIGSANATIFQMGELSGTGGRIAPNTTGVTLQVGALNTTPAAPFAGSITGTLALTKVGNGTLTLSGNNTHTGATNVSAGALRVTGNLTASATTVSPGAALGGEGSLGGALTLEAGATLRTDASTPSTALTTGGLVLNGPAFLTVDGASPTAALAQTARALNYSGSILGAGTLSVAGLRNATIDTATLGQINVTFDTKDLSWSGESGVWDLGTTANWNLGGDTFNQGDVISFDDNAANKNITLTGTVFPAAVTFANTAGNDYVIGGTGAIGGATSLTVNGTGAVTLSGQQSYTGTTTVNAGSLTTAGLNGPLTMNGGALTVTGTNGLSGTNPLLIPAGASVTLSGANNFTGATTNNGTLQLENLRSIATTASLALNNGGSLRLRSDTAGTFVTPTINVAASGTASIDVAPLTNGSPVLSLGTVRFTGNGSVSSTVNVTGSSGASLALASATIENTLFPGFTHAKLVLKPSTADMTVASISGISAGSGSDTDLVLDGTATGRLTGRISNPSGGGWMFLIKQGNGTWILSGSGSGHSGSTTINAGGGILRLDSPTAISGSAIQSFKTGVTTGTLQFNVPGNNTFTQSISSSSSTTFAGGGTATLQNLQGNTTLSGNLSINGTGGNGMNIQSDAGGTLTLTGTLRNTVANSNRLFDLGGAGNGEVSGLIADGTGTMMVTSLMKEGNGTWTISGGNNTYTGTTTVAGGTLALGPVGTLGTSKIVLNTGGTLNVSGLTASSFTAANGLGGNGTINATGKFLGITGTFTPGALSVTGSVTLGVGSTSTFVADSSPAASTAVVVTGTVQNGGTLVITPNAGFTFAAGQNFTFVSATSITRGYTGVTVNALPLAETPINSGVWKLTDTGLNYTFTESTGTLAVDSTVVITPLQAWRDIYFPVAGNDGTGIGALDQDPDGDGLSNLLEYATGTVPTAANLSGVTSGTNAGKLTLTFNRTDDPKLTYDVQGRNDLVTGTWTSVIAANNPTTGGTTSVTVEDEVAIPSPGKRFLRLQVTLAP